MVSINIATKPVPRYTAEGARAANITPLQELQRLTMACMLWEDNFYVDGKTIAQGIGELVHRISLSDASTMAIDARTVMKLRHVPLLICRYMANHPRRGQGDANHPRIIQHTLDGVIQRPDELTEFLAIYWKDGKTPLSAQVKKGLARAFTKFNEYNLAKYNRKKDIMLRDVLFLCHSKPADVPADAADWDKATRQAYKEQAGVYPQARFYQQIRPNGPTQGELLYGKLIYDQLATPDTWEVELSASKDKHASWLRLLEENKLGDLAFLRNMRNMLNAGIPYGVITKKGESRKWTRVLPFRFIAAARMVPQLEPAIEQWMLKGLSEMPKLPGKTIMLCDVSSSMNASLSAKSDLSRKDAMKALAILLREICEDVLIVPFAQTPLPAVPPRHGFALGDAIDRGQYRDGTRVGDAVGWALQQKHDRLIVITDEQSHDNVPNPGYGRNYMVNVASHQNGVGYGNWVHIDGFSEAIVDFIGRYESD